jgi:tRNA pseudouridine13 synthase
MNHPKILAGIKQNNPILRYLKSSPNDFVVEEIPLYKPCGEGEHLYLTVVKSNMSHDELVRKIANEFDVSTRNIGVAGRKDLRAVTTQTVSVHLPGANVEIPQKIGTVEIISSSLHTNKLRLGHLTGNRFVIRLRNLNPDSFHTIETKLREVERVGLPNAFGHQRFGNDGNNQILGKHLILEHWDGVTQELLAGGERHHKFAAEGEFKSALDAWPFGQPAERTALEALSAGKSSKQACQLISRPLKKLWVNALQSAIFNEVLEQRTHLGTWDSLEEGDLAWKHDGGGRTFEISKEESGSDAIASRSASFEISPTGPLWGKKMRQPSGDAFALEQEILSSWGIHNEHLASMKKFAQGARRPLRVKVSNPAISLGEDSVGQYFELTFELPAGSFATVVVEHVLSDVV